MIVSIWKNLQHLSAGKKSTSSFMFSLRYCKGIVNWLFLVLCACLILPSYRKLLCVSGGKNSTSSPMLSQRYCKDMQTYFGYFGHAWLHSPKMIVSPYWRRPCLSACKKNKLHNSLLTILCFKESCNLIGQQHFGP